MRLTMMASWMVVDGWVHGWCGGSLNSGWGRTDRPSRGLAWQRAAADKQIWRASVQVRASAGVMGSAGSSWFVPGGGLAGVTVGRRTPEPRLAPPEEAAQNESARERRLTHQRPRPSFLVPRPFRSESPSGFENLNPFSLKCSPSGSEVVGSSACHARQDIRG